MHPSGKHLFSPRRDGPRRTERAVIWALRAATYAILAAGAVIFGDIVLKGTRALVVPHFPFVNVAFFTEAPESLHVFTHEGATKTLGDRAFREFRAAEAARATAEGRPPAEIVSEAYVYSAGGILPCIVGTVLLVTGAMAIALVLGVSSAVYLSEYARGGIVVRFVRLSIINLAGVPSIVFGLFGMGLFVVYLEWNISLMAGWFTLAFMVLPVVITSSEESLRAVPQGFREASLALGATRWQTIRRAVLPYALPGVLTSSILGVARVAGETAPIMFTAAYVVRDKLPWQDLAHAGDFFFQGVMALPYHIYVVSAKIPQNVYTERVQYGTAFVFLMLVAGVALVSILLRQGLRARQRW
jgi:phosphate transport system permease protein